MLKVGKTARERQIDGEPEVAGCLGQGSYSVSQLQSPTVEERKVGSLAEKDAHAEL